MGCFDSVWLECPNCGERVEAQSKGGACIQGDYTLHDAPDDVITDVNRHAPFRCECGQTFKVAFFRAVVPA
jgi:hypothetical protein